MTDKLEEIKERFNDKLQDFKKRYPEDKLTKGDLFCLWYISKIESTIDLQNKLNIIFQKRLEILEHSANLQPVSKPKSTDDLPMFNAQGERVLK
jgi:hypothetical protein